MPYRLTTVARLPLEPARVFSFFSDAGNLEHLTPRWLRLRVDSPMPIAMAPGALIDYRLRLRGIPIRWRTEITQWDPPRQFVDEQRKGPYRWWIHSHTFTPIEGGTEVVDEVDYEVPGGALVNMLIVAPHLRRIFRYRHAALARALSVEPDRDAEVAIESVG